MSKTTLYRKWKKANAPIHHINHLLVSPLVTEAAKITLRAERSRLITISEPLRLAVLAMDW
jgi:hypothetical protein